MFGNHDIIVSASIDQAMLAYVSPSILQNQPVYVGVSVDGNDCFMN